MRLLQSSLAALALAILAGHSPPVRAGQAAGPGKTDETRAAQPATSGLDLARQLNQAFVELARKASPMVVVINVVQKAPTPSLNDDDEDSFDGMPPGFWREFHKHLERPPEKGLGEGSGIILRPNGYILTNRHVVEDAERIDVRLQDGRTFKAAIRGVDPLSDLAVLKIDAQGLPVATLADSAKTQVGEFVLAIGAPYSLDYSVTFGHISAKGRSNLISTSEGAAMDQDFLQTDALINPGNSGGPLLNLDGEVVGINTLIHGLHSGIGFAIPSNLAREVAEQLIAEGKFTRAWLGIRISAVRDQPGFRAAAPGVEDGVIVSHVLPGGPAARSDLRPSDVITAVDGTAVSTPQQLRAEVRGKTIGRPITLAVMRNGKAIQVKISPGEWAEPAAVVATNTKPAPGSTNAPAKVGLTVQALTGDLAKQFGVDSTRGVVVMTVEKDSLAAQKGVKPGDIITAIDQRTIVTPKQFRDALNRADLKKGLVLNLVSGETARFEILKEEQP